MHECGLVELYWEEKTLSTWRKTCPSATLSTTNFTWIGFSSDLWSCSNRLVTNHLRHTFILNLGTQWRWEVSRKWWPLYPQGKQPWLPLNRRLIGYLSQFRHFGEEKCILFLLGIKMIPQVSSPILLVCYNLLFLFSVLSCDRIYITFHKTYL